MFKKILVATHGTEGAKKAEAYASGLAKAFCADLHGLYVIHKEWSSLIGIEWLHSSSIRMDFYKHAESQFYLRAEDVLSSFRKVTSGLSVTTAVRVGEVSETIAQEAKEIGADLIVIGGESSFRSEEYKARVSLKRLLKLATCPVLMAGVASEIVKEMGVLANHAHS